MRVIAVIISIIVVLTIIAVPIGFGIYSATNVHDYKNVTVTEKAIKRSGDSDQYMIYTTLENGETRVFKNVDSLFQGKYNSADIYASIKAGGKYNFSVIGFRVPFWSMFENIVKVEAIK